KSPERPRGGVPPDDSGSVKGLNRSSETYRTDSPTPVSMGRSGASGIRSPDDDAETDANSGTPNTANSGTVKSDPNSRIAAKELPVRGRMGARTSMFEPSPSESPEGRG